MPEPVFVAEIEQEVIGLLLSGSVAYPQVASIVRPDHFMHHVHRLIYDGCHVAHNSAGSCKWTVAKNYVDMERVKSLLSQDEITPSQYAAHLISSITFGASNAVSSCRKVVEQWARISLATEYASLAESAGDAGADVKKIATLAGERTDEILSDVRRGSNRRSRYSILEATEGAIRSAQEARERGSGLTGITWGLNDINRLTGGMQRRDLTLVAARPSMGKTSVIMSCALKAAMRGFAIGFISLEMDAEKVAARQLSDLAYGRNCKVMYSDIIRGKISEQEQERLTEISEQLKGIPLYIEDQSGLRLNDIRVKLESLAEQAKRDGHELDALIIDHIGLIVPSGRYGGNRNNEMAEISAELKSMAREYNIAMIALSQLSRALEQRNDKRPIMSDLRDSGALEQDADTVIFLFREAYYLEREKGAMEETQRLERLVEVQNQLEFIIAKQRNGPVTTVKLFADMAYSAIRDLAA